jgi:hypothetical protein
VNAEDGARGRIQQLVTAAESALNVSLDAELNIFSCVGYNAENSLSFELDGFCSFGLWTPTVVRYCI